LEEILIFYLGPGLSVGQQAHGYGLPAPAGSRGGSWHSSHKRGRGIGSEKRVLQGGESREARTDYAEERGDNLEPSANGFQEGWEGKMGEGNNFCPKNGLLGKEGCSYRGGRRQKQTVIPDEGSHARTEPLTETRARILYVRTGPCSRYQTRRSCRVQIFRRGKLAGGDPFLFFIPQGGGGGGEADEKRGGKSSYKVRSGNREKHRRLAAKKKWKQRESSEGF